MDGEEVQVGVGGLDLDIGMKLSMSGIPYEGELFVRQHSPHYDSCTAVETQLSLLFHYSSAASQHMATMVVYMKNPAKAVEKAVDCHTY